MKYLHLCQDEKFIDFAFEQFEAYAPGRNIFLVGIPDANYSLRHIRANKSAVLLVKGSKEYLDFVLNQEYEVLVVHFLDLTKATVIKNSPRSKIILWLCWGADIYQSGFYKGNLYLPMTQQCLADNHKQSNFCRLFKNIFRSVFYYFQFKEPPKLTYKNAVKRVDFCNTVIPDEIDTLRTWKFFNAVQVPFSYTSIENEFKGLDIENSFCTGNGILVGNSGSPTSNHLDVFDKLSGLQVQGRKVIAPLSYGAKKWYSEKVKNSGISHFGKNFMGIDFFLQKEEYIKMVLNCNVAIMAHERQQGLANIIVCLWSGIKIFFSVHNIMYEYFKKKGFCVYSIQHDLNEFNINRSLTFSEVSKNRELLALEYSDKAVLTKTHSLINILEKKR